MCCVAPQSYGAAMGTDAGSRPSVPVTDGLVAAVFALAAAFEMGMAAAEYRLWLLLLVPVYTAPLIWRRRAALAVLATVLVVVSAVGVVDPRGDYLTPFGVVLFALYSVGAHCDRHRAIGGLGLVLAFFTVGTLLDNARVAGSRPVGDLLYMSGLNSVIWGLARLVHNWRDQARTLAERTTELEREREWRAQAAVAEERTRIARELHDVIAHSVGLMVVQAAAAEQVLDADPGQARQPLQEVQRTGREAVQELRTLLGVLRPAATAARAAPDGDGGELAPQPTLERLDELTARSRLAGVDIELRVEGEARPLPLGIELAAYRVVQEALTNVRKHVGPTTAQVCVRYGDGHLDVEIEDPGPGRPTAVSTDAGHGLIGMRERVAIYGGELWAGPSPGGGFLVHARLPIEQAAP
jgi:signal transduction histidine kinase